MKDSKGGGCGLLACLVIIIVTIAAMAKTCYEKRELHNSPLYQDLIRGVDSIKNLRELAHTNPEEYNRIIQEHEEQLREERMWKISTNDGDNTVRAKTKSANTVTITLPEPLKKHKKGYSGFKSFGECFIEVKYSKAKGNEVIIRISGASFIDKGSISAWFDDAASPIKYAYNDNPNTGYVYLKKSKDFINHCKQAKHIRLKIPITYIASNFDVECIFDNPGPLVWNH